MPKIATTDPQDELLTEVDKNNNIIGPIKRSLAHKSPGRIYRNIFVIVKDKKEKILLQKRSATKDLYPDCWDLSVGGHVEYGDSYLETALKELEEELGITATEEEMKFVGEVLVRLKESQEYFHVFEYNMQDKDEILTEENEISEIMWMSLDDIKQSIREHSLKWYGRPAQVIEFLY